MENKYQRLKLIVLNTLTEDQFEGLEKSLDDLFVADKDKYIINEILDDRSDFKAIREESIADDFYNGRDDDFSDEY